MDKGVQKDIILGVLRKVEHLEAKNTGVAHIGSIAAFGKKFQNFDDFR